MSWSHLKQRIEALWDAQDAASFEGAQALDLLQEVVQALECGHVAIVERSQQADGENVWRVNVWVKKAILLMFRFYQSQKIQEHWWDKIPLLSLDQETLRARHLRIVPGAWVRRGVFLAPFTIIMPSFINIGAYIDQHTMIDSGVAVGSAFIGKSCHISSNSTIGGVLEPLQNRPVIIEDHCFLGAGCHVLEGVHIEEGSVLGAGLVLTASTKIITRTKGNVVQDVHYGRVPRGSVVVPGSISDVNGLALQCAVIVKQTDAQTRAKTSLTDLLRV